MFALLAACQGGQDDGTSAYPTLPFPKVKVEKMPAATATDVTEEATPSPLTPTVTAELQAQAWPTLDEEDYLLSQLDALFNKMENELNSTDTRLKP